MERSISRKVVKRFSLFGGHRVNTIVRPKEIISRLDDQLAISREIAKSLDSLLQAMNQVPHPAVSKHTARKVSARKGGK